MTGCGVFCGFRMVTQDVLRFFGECFPAACEIPEGWTRPETVVTDLSKQPNTPRQLHRRHPRADPTCANL